MSSQIPKIIIGLLLLSVIGFGSYVVYTRGIGGISIAGFVLPSEESPVGSDILVLAEKIKRTVIEPEIFDSPLFRNLKDLSATLFPEAQGRSNPFAPIGNDTASAITSSGPRNTGTSR